MWLVAQKMSNGDFLNQYKSQNPFWNDETNPPCNNMIIFKSQIMLHFCNLENFSQAFQGRVPQNSKARTSWVE
jgi:hypothetical protein